MIGMTCGALGGVFIVIECFARKAVASAALSVEKTWCFGEVLEEASTGAEHARASSAAFSVFLRFFFSFFSFLESDVLGVPDTSARVSSCSSRFRFFIFSLFSVKSAIHR